MSKSYVADFETVTYKGQESTEVWASGWREIGTEITYIENNIDAFLNAIFKTKENQTVYFHNLKFDGSFILIWLHKNQKYHHGLNSDGTMKSKKSMNYHDFIYTVSSRGVFYSITVKTGKNIFVKFLDSYKLLPFSVANIAKSWDMEISKGSIDYTAHRSAYEKIKDDEKNYLKTDLAIPHNAIKMMLDDGHDRSTIGSCCLAEYKRSIGVLQFNEWFPEVHRNILFDNVDEDTYVRKSYRGGWCYLVEGKERKIFKNGYTWDVNSLYPFVMLARRYPVGCGTFVKGCEHFERIFSDDFYYYFVRIECKFDLKEGHLPFIQIKDNAIYRGNEMLKSSKIEMVTGNLLDEPVILTLTKTDFERFLVFYDVEYKILDYIYYETDVNLFDKYLLKYKSIKESSTGGKRQLAKLFSNNLYGKLATSRDSSYKVSYIDNDVLKWRTVIENNMKPVYIPAGSAITSYARDYTIRTAQKNYHGVDKQGFIYADTDSIHCDLAVDGLVGIEQHDTEYGKWKCEKMWEKGWFVRQKTYIEQGYDGKVDIACAGMPQASKDIFIKRFEDGVSKLEDFDYGLSLSGKLRFKQIKGGAVLVEDDFTMKQPSIKPHGIKDKRA